MKYIINECDACACNIAVSYARRVRRVPFARNTYTASDIYIYIYCNRVFREQTAGITGRKPRGSNPIHIILYVYLRKIHIHTCHIGT